jgi:hypothetical protein
VLLNIQHCQTKNKGRKNMYLLPILKTLEIEYSFKKFLIYLYPVKNEIKVIYVRRLWNNLLTYGHTEQHAIFTYQTSNTQFIDAPEDGPVGPKHIELSNILRINIQA